MELFTGGRVCRDRAGAGCQLIEQLSTVSKPATAFDFHRKSVFDIAVAYDLLQFSPVNKTLHRPTVIREEKPTLPVEKGV